MSFAVSTDGLTKKFGTFSAVDGLSLKVEAGSFYGFLGPNGAGKSTTMKMLTGIMNPTSGTAQVAGFDIMTDPVKVKSKIGVVPEQLFLFSRLTVREQLTMCGRFYGLSQDEVKVRREELLDFFDLADFADRLVEDCSRGMKKKLSLASALLHQPEVLFLDEPFEGIDTIISKAIKEILHELTRRGITIFLTSHILEIVEKLCDKVGIISNGRLVIEGSIDEIREKHKGNSLEEVFINAIGEKERHVSSLNWLEKK